MDWYLSAQLASLAFIPTAESEMKQRVSSNTCELSKSYTDPTMEMMEIFQLAFVQNKISGQVRGTVTRAGNLS